MRKTIHVRRDRDELIRKSVEEIGSYAQVAEQFGLTRQRIEQIYRNGNSLRKMPFGDGRTKAQLARMAPFLSLPLKEEYRCLVCGAYQNKTNGAVCKRCRAARQVLADLKASLRTYKNTGHQFGLNQAAYLVRKHSIKPEDLRFV